jgi:CMP-N,N'-diacetyllegionaminic acid synthase
LEPLITICARAGSKGLPGKNTRLMHGKPLIQHTIDQSDTWSIERGGAVIVVSSDDPEVRRIALKNNLFHVERRPELATDEAGKVPAIRDAWRKMEHRLARVFDVVIDLDVTNPMRRIEDIEAVYGIASVQEFGFPLTVFSVTKARRNPFFNMWPRTTEGILSLTRQDTPEMFDLNCNIYAYSREFMLSDKERVIQHDSIPYLMPDWSFCDIDSEMDFEIVRFLMEEYAQEMGQAPY